MNLPNGISLLRILFIPLIVYLLLAPSQYGAYWAAAIFAVVAVSDALDGYIARKTGQVTRLGKFLDPMADKLLVLCSLLALVETGWVPSVAVMLLIVRDLAVSGLRMMAGSSGKIIAADRLGKYKAAVLDVAVIMIILKIAGGIWILWIGVILAILSGINYFRSNWSSLNG